MYITAFYFGFSIAMFGKIDFKMWQFYAISVPVVIGYSVYAAVYKDEK